MCFSLGSSRLSRVGQISDRGGTYVHDHIFCMNATLTNTCVGVYIIRELKGDMRFTAGEEKFKLKYLWQCLTDRKTYATCGSLPS
jgi:hypothetical protein